MRWTNIYRFLQLFPLFVLSEIVETLGTNALSIKAHPQSLSVRVGQTVTLPCNVSGQGFNPFYNPIIWYKTLGKQEIQINTGAVVSEPFITTGRYRSEPEMTDGADPMISMPLTISGLTLGDNGTYICKLYQSQNAIASVKHTITVLAPIKQLQISSNNATLDDQRRLIFNFNELEASFVKCITKGGHPRPHLRMYRGDTDITSEFKETVKKKWIGKPVLREVDYTVTLADKSFRAEIDYSGRILRCHASVPGMAGSQEETEALVNVRYPPKFTCPTIKAVFPGTENYTMVCAVKANPQVDPASVLWTLAINTENKTVIRELKNGDSIDGYSANLTLENGSLRLTLTIANVTKSSYQVYRIKASNRLNEKHHQIKLLEAVETTPYYTTVSPEAETEKPSPKKGESKPVVNENNQEGPINSARDLTSSALISLAICALLGYFL